MKRTSLAIDDGQAPKGSLRVAHFSDLHILALRGLSPVRLLNKRLSGYANLRFKRKHIHRPAYVRAIAREITSAGIDHVVITGDLTNLALESEFEAALALLQDELGLDAADVTVVPGNHDLYTRGSHTTGRFARYFGDFLVSDLPDLAVPMRVGAFPVVKLRGPAAIIGLSSAVPRPPLVAAGKLGGPQLEALRAVLRHPEVTKRTPVVALHHPAHNPPSLLKTLLEGLHDAKGLLQALDGVEGGLLLHGHLHTRIHRTHSTTRGKLHAVGATSASLDHQHPAKMAGFNVYSIDARGQVEDLAAHVFDPVTESFHVESIPKHVR